MFEEVRDEGDGEIHNTEVTISGHSKTSNHMETYLLYHVDFSSTKGSFSVSRRYGDFDWLSRSLMERYTMAIIPPLPQKHSIATIERFEGYFIKQRQAALAMFLTRLVSHPIVGLDNDLWLFLTLSTTAFVEHKKCHPVLGKLESLLMSFNSLTNGVASHSDGGCVDNLYKAELDKSLESTVFIGSLLRRLERVVSKSSENLESIGLGAEKGESQLSSFGVLSDFGQQCVVTSRAIKERVEPWVTECGLYCIQAEKAARKRDNVEAKFLASKKAQSRPSLSTETTQELHDALSRSNADLKSEYDRWQTQKSVETKQWLTTFADIHVDHFQRTSDIWRQFLSTLHTVVDGGHSS